MNIPCVIQTRAGTTTEIGAEIWVPLVLRSAYSIQLISHPVVVVAITHNANIRLRTVVRSNVQFCDKAIGHVTRQ